MWGDYFEESTFTGDTQGTHDIIFDTGRARDRTIHPRNLLTISEGYTREREF